MKRLRILLLVDPYIPVPPRHYGGIERVIADLATEYSRRGHDVTLWAGPGSEVPGKVESFGSNGRPTRLQRAAEVAVIAWRLHGAESRFDVVHNFGRLALLARILRSGVPKVQTYMRRIDPVKVRLADRLRPRHLQFTAVSRVIRDTAGNNGGDWAIVYNCTSTTRYQPRFDTNPHTAPLAFLGRLERCKGAHTAIKIAKTLHRTLHLAGNVSDLPEEREYFETEIKPEIDGNLIHYLGPVDDQQKNSLLANAAALLAPVEWLEPFPIVIPEALMCGTPVIAFNRGGMAEGIDPGATGYLCENLDEMLNAVQSVSRIDRRRCRHEAEARFGVEAVADEYERLYETLIAKRSRVA